MYRSFVVCVLLSVVFIFSALVSWYEGSALLDKSWEWAHSAPFSQMINGEVMGEEQIVQLDYFVYAAKFRPLFPMLMFSSFILLLLAVGSILTKGRWKGSMVLLALLGAGLFAFSFLSYASSTIGGHLFFYFGIAAGMFAVGSALLMYVRFGRRTV
ncbi:YjdJ family protein [Halobacillus kuroshimensis]|uniref:YjdJ family protein n=1 Tax=Halobacillus kuroshimensis TaxID=302481 RepID=UPI00042476B8|nr:YjdJ family protein [Halobacillus kuroshimensis]